MDRDEFWRLIEDCAEGRSNPEDFEELLRERLEELDDADVLAFDDEFRSLSAEAYDWGLWGAAYVIGGGCSDDSFEYFRSWLICQGQDSYEAALADPDSLAELAVELEDPEEILFGFESMAYVATEIWQERHGSGELPERGPMAGLEPSGEAFDEDDAPLLRNRYPQLWDHFGGDELDEFEIGDD